MADFFISTASDPAAYQLLDFLQDRGFVVYDPILADGASLVVFHITKAKLKKAIKEADLSTPHKIRISEISRGELVR